MPFQRNVETKKAITEDVKTLRSNCKDICNIIDNTPPNAYHILPERDTEQSLCYVEGLRSDIHNSTTRISTDENLLTIQFLDELKEKTAQVEELAAFTRGIIHDKDAEIERIKNLIQIAKEAKSRPMANSNEILPEHLVSARQKFQQLKSELQGLITSLYPNIDSELISALTQLMQPTPEGSTNPYISVNRESLTVIETLKDMGIVVANPYNITEFKLAY